MTRSEIASLGPLVTREALSGDRLSQEIIEKGSESMSECISTVARHLDLKDNIEIALTGGVFQAGDIVIKPLIKAVLEKLPSSTIIISELPPVLGACLLALELLDVKLSIQNLHILKEKASLIKNLLN
jgi:N-acetylglucosamine kinase-like BadF-type ATPase